MTTLRLPTANNGRTAVVAVHLSVNPAPLSATTASMFCVRLSATPVDVILILASLDHTNRVLYKRLALLDCLPVNRLSWSSWA